MTAYGGREWRAARGLMGVEGEAGRGLLLLCAKGRETTGEREGSTWKLKDV